MLLAAFLEPVDPQRARDWAENLVDRFGSLPGALAASSAALNQATGDSRAVRQLLTAKAVMQHCLMPGSGTARLTSAQDAVAYLTLSMVGLAREEVRALFLNSRNKLIKEEVVATGSVTEAPVYPREIVRRALDLGATGLIIAHNHPSGDCRPSDADIRATREVAEAAKLFGIRLHDHLIIARCGASSLRALGYL